MWDHVIIGKFLSIWPTKKIDFGIINPSLTRRISQIHMYGSICILCHQSFGMLKFWRGMVIPLDYFPKYMKLPRKDVILLMFKFLYT